VRRELSDISPDVLGNHIAMHKKCQNYCFSNKENCDVQTGEGGGSTMPK